MNPNRYDLWDVNSAASGLIGQAMTISARHLGDGMTCMQFNREVAYCAKRIVDDVTQGHKTPEQGIQAILQEQRDLLSQSLALARKDVIPHTVRRMSLMRLTQPVYRPDPQRLLRYVHVQDLKTQQKAQSLTTDVPSSLPAHDLKFFPRERWPEPIARPQEPGFYIVPKSTTAAALQARLFTSGNPAVIARFKALNPGLDQVKAGQMIVLSDPHNLQCTLEEAQLMAAADKVNTVLQTLTPDEADFMARHRDEIESFLTLGSTSIGTGMAVFASNLDNVKSVLRDIEALHQRSFLRDGHLRSPEFFAERKRLLRLLDSHLNGLTKKGIGFPDHPNLKSALGISSRSLVHRWTKAGAPGQIPGYATHMDGVAKAAKYVKYGGWLGTALGGGASYMKVQEVCATGDEQACKKVEFTEGGSFLGGVAGGAIAGSILTSSTVGAICLGLGVPTVGAGTFVCGLIVVGVGSLTAGASLGWAGEKAGELIYEVSQ